jgi:hypothetical protein
MGLTKSRFRKSPIYMLYMMLLLVLCIVVNAWKIIGDSGSAVSGGTNLLPGGWGYYY